MNSNASDAPASNFRGVEGLREVEAIKQLKARYCRYLDNKDWDAWRAIFADDFLSDTSESGGDVIAGADSFVAYTRGHIGKASQPTVHHVHAPEIELTAATTATGVWALEDVVRLAPGLNLKGYGHYHETYEKIDGRWYIKSSKLTRLREDLFNPVFTFRIPERLRDAAGALVRKRTK
ncbi:MAG TPA: nuclear transport factor 2 family protein [Mycobacterium sp.]|jgi:hypothetical protein|nr:nuclear transport factor 2 family protein [Mycobacterium sp.]